MKDYDKNKESWYLKYWNVNMDGQYLRSYLWAFLKLLEETSQFNESFIKSYSEDSDEGYFHEVDVQYPEEFYEFDNDLSFLPKIMKIEKVEKFVANLHDKKEYVIHT